tara:strand:+ start:3170 stop:3793 length:624 start_codon:yes stop_codon:yes gene_type:complete
MAYDPVDFLHNTDNRGSLALANKFSVSIIPPTSFYSEAIANGPVDFLCHTAEFPGMTLATTEDRLYGVEIAKPYATTFEAVTLTFYVTNNFDTKIFFEDWMRYIQEPKSKNMRYYDDFVGSVEIYHYNEHIDVPAPGMHTYRTILVEAWPITMQEHELNWESGEIMEIQIQISYRDWNRFSASQDNQRPVGRGGSGFLRSGAAGGPQ